MGSSCPPAAWAAPLVGASLGFRFREANWVRLMDLESSAGRNLCDRCRVSAREERGSCEEEERGRGGFEMEVAVGVVTVVCLF